MAEEIAVKEKYMKEALRQAKKAAEAGDVPIGCVIVYKDKIIARGYNKRNQQKTALGHAEIAAIRKASKKLGDWRLEECTMYVTLEPCPMCAGAIVQARIPEVVIGAMNPKAGCAGSIINVMIFPLTVDLGKVMKQSLTVEGQLLQKSDGREIIRHNICFNTVKTIFTAYQRNQKGEGLHHIAFAEMVFVCFISDHTTGKSTPEKITETDSAHGNLRLLFVVKPHAQIAGFHEGIIFKSEV